MQLKIYGRPRAMVNKSDVFRGVNRAQLKQREANGISRLRVAGNGKREEEEG